MKFSLELLLERRRLDVWRAFENQENLMLWQPMLQSVRYVQGTPGQEGSIFVLTYAEKGRQVMLEQVILERTAPQRYVTRSYGVQLSNEVVNQFIAEGASQTRWVLEAEYRFRSLLRVLSPFLRRSVRDQTLREMQNFKQFVEGG